MNRLLHFLRRKARDSSRAVTDGYREAGFPIEVAGSYEPEFENFAQESGQNKDAVKAPWERARGTAAATVRRGAEETSGS